ncbi:MAG: hypothetical protein ACYC1Q_06905, partial [Bacteroidia bacterium]
RLRTKQGIMFDEFETEFGRPLKDQLIESIRSENMAPYFLMDDDSLHLNKEGYLLADYLISELFWD